jgi:hypothetical protein
VLGWARVGAFDSLGWLGASGSCASAGESDQPAHRKSALTHTPAALGFKDRWRRNFGAGVFMVYLRV